MDTRIRIAAPADAAGVLAIYAPSVSDSATSFETAVPDAAEIQRRIETLVERFPWLVFECGGRILGYAYASPHRTRAAYQWSAEVSVYVDEAFRRRGVGRALYTALLELLRRQRFVNAYAGITLPNPSSVGLHESFGFVPVGVFRGIGFKFDEWHDVMWLHLRLQDGRPASAPLALADVCADDAVTTMLGACARMVQCV
jgi:phosphinothricin acetyltransferase